MRIWVYGDLLAAGIGLAVSPMTCSIGALSHVVQILREHSQVETSRPLQFGGTARIVWLQS